MAVIVGDLVNVSAKTILLLGFCWCVLISPASAVVSHVVHISVDGLRGDLLKSLVDESPDLYPNFQRFVAEGATTFNARTDVMSTVTMPNHISMLTGRPMIRPVDAPITTHHGYTYDGDVGPGETLHTSGNANLSYIASTFDVAHDNGFSTAMYAGKEKFELFNRSYDAANGGLDTTVIDNGRDKIDSFTTHAFAHTRFLDDFREHKFGYSFLHFLHPDGDGHNAGWGSPSWNNIVRYVDTQLGNIMNTVLEDPELAHTTVLILTADHGGSGTSHEDVEDPANYTIPVLVWGRGVQRGADLYALNETTRLEPGSSRPRYDALLQPIRNGDTGNLALSLLGLESIPGSSINALQDLNAIVPEPSAIALGVISMAMLSLLRPASTNREMLEFFETADERASLRACLQTAASRDARRNLQIWIHSRRQDDRNR